MPTTKTLWSDLSRTRHFLIPDSEKPPSGNFVLRTPTGRQQQVDPQALAPFEVTQEQAKAWLKDQFGQLVETAKGAVMKALRQGVTPPQGFQQQAEPNAPPVRTADPTNVTESPLLSLLSALSGEPAERLRNDTESLLSGLKMVAETLGGVFQDATSTEEDGLEKARHRIRELRTRLQAQGLPLNEQAEKIPEWLQQQFRSIQQSDDAEKTAVALISMADELEKTGALAAQALRSLAQQLSSAGPHSGPYTNSSEDIGEKER